jgi:hypothetical protein
MLIRLLIKSDYTPEFADLVRRLKADPPPIANSATHRVNSSGIVYRDLTIIDFGQDYVRTKAGQGGESRPHSFLLWSNFYILMEDGTEFLNLGVNGTEEERDRFIRYVRSGGEPVDTVTTDPDDMVF